MDAVNWFLETCFRAGESYIKMAQLLQLNHCLSIYNYTIQWFLFPNNYSALEIIQSDDTIVKFYFDAQGNEIQEEDMNWSCPDNWFGDEE